MFLIDTNCWMQLARGRAQAADVREMLDGIPQNRIFVSIFGLHSIGVIFRNREMIEAYVEFLRESSIGHDIQIVDVPLRQFDRIVGACSSHGLDFDDAYQYVAAELHNLKLVSLDADFDRTPNGRLTPGAAL